ncbi:MAG: CoA-binding protein [Mailhella sp.]|nr:CoA-binding protein [Mailhella sp.]
MDSSRIALDALFHPRSMAIIGASEKPGSFNAGKTKLLLQHYKGTLYLVHPKHSVIFDQQTFPSVLDIPDHVDMALIMVPAPQVPQVVEECGQKGIAIVQILSGGFGESGDEGRKMENALKESARRWNMRIVGPNCIGTYSPSEGIWLAEGSSSVSGNVGFISQSGGLAVDFVVRGNSMGLRYSKFVSIGNCIDLDHADYLEYLANDPETEIIGLYLESVKNGRRFMEILKKITPHKPVVILKGGRTDAGMAATSSHTGGLAGAYDIWQAMFEQCGVIEVTSSEEMLDALLALQLIRPSAGGVAMLGNGGGATVLATDSCMEEGLRFAELSEETKEELCGCSKSISDHNINPIDLPAMDLGRENGRVFGRILKLFADDANTGYILFHLNLISFTNQGDLEGITARFTEEVIALAQSGANILAVLRYSGCPAIENVRCAMAQALGEHGIPVFMTLDDGLRAIRFVNNLPQREVCHA